MKKSYLKTGVIGGSAFLIAALIKNILDQLAADKYLYILVFIPILIDFIYNYKYFSSVIKDE